jgi:hypothetical protein
MALLLLLAVVLFGCPLLRDDQCLKQAERAENDCG